MEAAKKSSQRSRSSVEKTVTFCDHLTVYTAGDYDRINIWMEYVADRYRFQRRVQNVKNTIGYIFEKHYRDKMFAKLYV